MHFACGDRMPRVRTDQCIVQTLVIALAMIMRDELGSRFAYRTLAEQDHPLQTRFLDRPHKPFSVGMRGGSFTEATPVSASIFRN